MSLAVGTVHPELAKSRERYASVVLGARRNRLGYQGVHVGCTFGGAVKVEMQGGHRVRHQPFEEAISQKASGLIQRFFTLFWVAYQHTEKNFGVGIVGRNFHRLDRHHTHTRVLQLARDQLRQITLDLIGDAKTAVRGG